jgi:hypothetical protein
MEFLIVKFDEERDVLIDEVNQGKTGELIELSAGTYTVSLDGEEDFTPKTKKIRLKKTSPIKPMEVTFERV